MLVVARQLRRCLLVASCALLSSCALVDEDNITLLAGHYYTANMGEGVALHWYPNLAEPSEPPLLESVYETRLTKGYLIARAGINVFFLFPLRAASLAEADAGRLGPMTRAEVPQHLLRLTGDTLSMPVGPF